MTAKKASRATRKKAAPTKRTTAPEAHAAASKSKPQDARKNGIGCGALAAVLTVPAVLFNAPNQPESWGRLLIGIPVNFALAFIAGYLMTRLWNFLVSRFSRLGAALISATIGLVLCVSLVTLMNLITFGSPWFPSPR